MAPQILVCQNQPFWCSKINISAPKKKQWRGWGVGCFVRYELYRKSLNYELCLYILYFFVNKSYMKSYLGDVHKYLLQLVFVDHEIPLSQHRGWGVSWRINCARKSSSMKYAFISSYFFVYSSTHYAYFNKAGKYKYHFVFLMSAFELCFQMLSYIFFWNPQFCCIL